MSTTFSVEIVMRIHIEPGRMTIESCPATSAIAEMVEDLF